MDMRSAINAAKLLFEMPGLLSGKIDFGLNDEDTNRRFAAKFDAPGAVTLVDTPRAKLMMVGDRQGMVGLLGKGNGHLYYFVSFTTQNVPAIGGTVTQVALWRSGAAPAIFPRVTERVFFDVLVPRFGAVMSDTLQTEDGRTFWVRVMGLAEERGLSVWMFDQGRGTLVKYDPAALALDEWIDSLDIWGETDAHEDKRVIIGPKS